MSQQGGNAPTVEELLQVNAELAESLYRLRLAVDRLYFAAYWHPDRQVDERALWTAVRDAAKIKPGQTGELLGEDRSLRPEGGASEGFVQSGHGAVKTTVVELSKALETIFHNVDENGDPIGAQPETPWEKGYCAGLRFAYRVLKSRGIALPPSTPQGSEGK